MQNGRGGSPQILPAKTLVSRLVPLRFEKFLRLAVPRRPGGILRVVCVKKLIAMCEHAPWEISSKTHAVLFFFLLICKEVSTLSQDVCRVEITSDKDRLIRPRFAST